jgi:hypothetical protein
VLEPDAREPGGERAGLGVEPLQRRILHLEPAGELLDEQAAVGANEDLAGTQIASPFEAADYRGVLGDVVRRDADPLGDLGPDGAGVVNDADADPRGAGIATRGAVARDDQTKNTIRRQYSHLLMSSVCLSLSSSTAESFCWQAWHTPSTIAAAPIPFFCRRRSS